MALLSDIISFPLVESSLEIFIYTSIVSRLLCYWIELKFV